MKTILVFVLGVTVFNFGLSQEVSFDFETKFREANTLFDDGQTRDAIALYELCLLEQPDNFDVNLKLSFSLHLTKNFTDAIEILKKLKAHRSANAAVYQLLGICYQDQSDWLNAIYTFEEGIERFPDFGGLYTDRGKIELYRDDINKAMLYFEKGIEKDPNYASNYYWGTRIYCNTTEQVWGMIYGEIFINLEPNTARTEEMSRLLFDVYKGEITLGSEATEAVDFSQIADATPDIIHNMLNHEKPFATGVYEPILLTSIRNEKQIDLNSLNRIRSKFLDLYFEKNHHKEEYYSNVLFTYQKIIQDSGHLEAYNHWLLLMGNENEFMEWAINNKDKYDAFMDWFHWNKLEIKS